NNDPRQSIIFAATGDGPNSFLGEGNTERNQNANQNLGPRSSIGVGILRSMDGGATWTLLDSTDNSLPFSAAAGLPQRDHRFVRRPALKIVVDPHRAPSSPNDAIVYAALSDVDANGNPVNGTSTSGGLWRSMDSGVHWTRLIAGQATDVVLDPNSSEVDAILN